jgi:hypothetical protein
LTFVPFKLNLKSFKKLLLLGGGGEDERVQVSSRSKFKVETVAFIGEETKLTLKFITTLYIRNVTALERSKIWVEL